MYRMEILNFHTLKTDQFLNVKIHDSCRHVWQITKQIFLTLNKLLKLYFTCQKKKEKKRTAERFITEGNINWR